MAAAVAANLAGHYTIITTLLHLHHLVNLQPPPASSAHHSSVFFFPAPAFRAAATTTNTMIDEPPLQHCLHSHVGNKMAAVTVNETQKRRGHHREFVDQPQQFEPTLTTMEAQIRYLFHCSSCRPCGGHHLHPCENPEVTSHSRRKPP